MSIQLTETEIQEAIEAIYIYEVTNLFNSSSTSLED